MPPPKVKKTAELSKDFDIKPTKRPYRDIRSEFEAQHAPEPPFTSTMDIMPGTIAVVCAPIRCSNNYLGNVGWRSFARLGFCEGLFTIGCQSDNSKAHFSLSLAGKYQEQGRFCFCVTYIISATRGGESKQDRKEYLSYNFCCKVVLCCLRTYSSPRQATREIQRTT
jgi:hypothetical protein